MGFEESKVSPNIKWLRDKAKWVILPLSVVLPVTYFLSIDLYVSFKEGLFLDSTRWAVRLPIVASFWLMLTLGLVTIPRWYSIVAFLSVAAFIFVGLTGYP